MCSRREAEALIAAGAVTIDGRAIADPGHKIMPGQTLALRQAGGPGAPGRVTVMVHKPVGYVSAQPERGQIPAARLVSRGNRWGGGLEADPGPRARLAPLGRLDLDSRGLLLLSEDGVLAKAVIGPLTGLDKEYEVRVTGTLTPAKLALLRHGLTLDGRALKPAEVAQRGGQDLRFILREGRNRQIRRMCEAVGLTVTDLFRTRIGPVRLGDLPEGRWRPLTPEERAALLAGSR